MSKSRGNKIVVIGAGNVGEAVSYTLMAKKQVSEIVMIDIEEGRARGCALDISHGTSFFHQTNVVSGGYEECADADIIIVTAGIARKPGQTRLELAQTNVSIGRSIARSIMEYAKNPLIIVVSNPVDILTRAICEEAGLPASRVISSGTSLDTARLKYLISRKCGVNVCDVNAYVLGEHGDSQVPMWSTANIGGEKVLDYLRKNDPAVDMDAIAKEAKVSGAEIISLKGATFYGVAMAVARIVDAIIRDENAVLSVGHVLGEAYGEWAGVAFSLPCVVNGEGIARVIDISMDEKEKQAMDHSANTLREFWENIK